MGIDQTGKNDLAPRINNRRPFAARRLACRHSRDPVAFNNNVPVIDARILAPHGHNGCSVFNDGCGHNENSSAGDF